MITLQVIDIFSFVVNISSADFVFVRTNETRDHRDG